MRKPVIVVALLLVACSLGFMRMADPFEGTKWNVVLTPDPSAGGNDKEFNDTLIFKGGMFRSTECEKKGFKPVQYDENTTRMGPATFTAEPASAKEGKAKWTGTVTANMITGDMVWTKKDGTEVHYTFKGERQG
jgi:hypothetical protein